MCIKVYIYIADRTVNNKAMTLKTYNQNCGLAAALDVIGDRWTFLIIRGLLGGPLRFGELQGQLPGIGTNLLAARLKSLAHRGLATKHEGQQGEYRLTDKGKALRPMILGLASWGQSFLPLTGARSNPAWTMFNIEAAFRPERAQGLNAVVEFQLGADVFHMVIRNQDCRAAPGPALAPDVCLRSESEQFLGKGVRLQIQGDSAVFDQVRPCFNL